MAPVVVHRDALVIDDPGDHLLGIPRSRRSPATAAPLSLVGAGGSRYRAI
jgi:hypothetical protein